MATTEQLRDTEVYEDWEHLKVVSRISKSPFKVVERVRSVASACANTMIIKRYINLDKEVPDFGIEDSDEASDCKDMAFNEIVLLKQLSHININSLFGVSCSAQSIQLLLEDGGSPFLIKGNDDFYSIKVADLNFPPDENSLYVLTEHCCRIMFKQIAEAVQHCHSKNICHSDLKPNNIVSSPITKAMVRKLYKSQNDSWELELPESSENDMNQNVDVKPIVKIVDFDTARSVKGRDTPCSGTSKPFMPPESLINLASDGYAKDVWALGCILYIALTGTHPVLNNGYSGLQYYCDAIEAKVPPVSFAKHNYVSAEAQSLIRNMLNPNVRKRCTIKQVLEHKWLSL